MLLIFFYVMTFGTFGLFSPHAWIVNAVATYAFFEKE